MLVKAEAKFIKTTSRKTRLVVDLIRNKNVEEAMGILKFCRKEAAIPVADVLKNAISIAKDREMNIENTIVKETFCNEGPRLKRGISAGRGHIRPIQKQMCHITVILAEKEVKNKKISKKIATDKKPAKSEKTVKNSKTTKKEKEDI